MFTAPLGSVNSVFQTDLSNLVVSAPRDNSRTCLWPQYCGHTITTVYKASSQAGSFEVEIPSEKSDLYMLYTVMISIGLVPSDQSCKTSIYERKEQASVRVRVSLLLKFL